MVALGDVVETQHISVFVESVKRSAKSIQEMEQCSEPEFIILNICVLYCKLSFYFLLLIETRLFGIVLFAERRA